MRAPTRGTMRNPGPSDAILERLLALHPKIIDLTLDRVWRLLADMGDPQRALPPVVHIAGTNGKGSTLAMIRAGQTTPVSAAPQAVSPKPSARRAATASPAFSNWCAPSRAGGSRSSSPRSSS